MAYLLKEVVGAQHNLIASGRCMIVHLAPRRVTLVSKEDGDQTGAQIDLNTVLAVNVQVDEAKQIAVVVRLTNQEHIVAGIYRRMAEAGPDCGRLRVLAGLPAWADLETVSDPTIPPRSSYTLVTARLVLAALTAFALAAAGFQGVMPLPT